MAKNKKPSPVKKAVKKSVSASVKKAVKKSASASVKKAVKKSESASVKKAVKKSASASVKKAVKKSASSSVAVADHSNEFVSLPRPAEFPGTTPLSESMFRAGPSKRSRPTRDTEKPRKSAPVAREKGAKALRKGEIRETLLVVAGEHSGDLLGGDVVRALRNEGFSKFLGTGGTSMEEAGVELVERVEEMAVVGFMEALKAYPALKKLAHRLTDLCVERGVRYALLIDYPGFNLRLAAMLQEKGIGVIFLVSPQIWAWKYGRIKGIRRNVDLMLTLFPFEKDLYDSEGVQAEWIGHPLVTRLKEKLQKEEPIPGRASLTVGLLPGSRTSEVSRLLPVMLEAAELLQRQYSGIRFLVPGVNPRTDEFIKQQIQAHPDLKLEYVWNRSLRVMEASDVVVLASGTATLETAWFLKPMVIVYRVGMANFLIASMVIRTRFIGMVNLLARKQAALELLQSEASASNIVDEVRRILEDGNYRADIMNELRYVKSSLGTGDPARTAAAHIREHILTDRKKRRS